MNTLRVSRFTLATVSDANSPKRAPVNSAPFTRRRRSGRQAFTNLTDSASVRNRVTGSSAFANGFTLAQASADDTRSSRYALFKIALRTVRTRLAVAFRARFASAVAGLSLYAGRLPIPL